MGTPRGNRAPFSLVFQRPTVPRGRSSQHRGVGPEVRFGTVVQAASCQVAHSSPASGRCCPCPQLPLGQGPSGASGGRGQGECGWPGSAREAEPGDGAEGPVPCPSTCSDVAVQPQGRMEGAAWVSAGAACVGARPTPPGTPDGQSVQEPAARTGGPGPPGPSGGQAILRPTSGCSWGQSYRPGLIAGLSLSSAPYNVVLTASSRTGQVW